MDGFKPTSGVTCEQHVQDRCGGCTSVNDRPRGCKSTVLSLNHELSRSARGLLCGFENEPKKFSRVEVTVRSIANSSASAVVVPLREGEGERMSRLWKDGPAPLSI